MAEVFEQVERARDTAQAPGATFDEAPGEAAAEQARARVLAGRADSATRARAVLGMQAELGNAAVARMLRVQRCGGQVHAGCGCAGGAGQAREDEEVLRADGRAVQRQPNPPPSAATEDKSQLKPDSPYRKFPGPLIETLRRSYQAQSMLMGHKPDESLDDVLDRISLASLNGLAQVYSRAGGLWDFVDTITWTWATSSRGFRFKPAKGGLQAAVIADPRFCKDTKVGQIYHSGQECWREMVTGGPGLHVCIGGEYEFHIDPHQAVAGKGHGALTGIAKGAAAVLGLGFGGIFGAAAAAAATDQLLGGGSGDMGDYCIYDPVGFLSHGKDVFLGGNEPDVPERADNAQSEIGNLLGRIGKLSSEHAKDCAGFKTDLETDRDNLKKLMPKLRAFSAGQYNLDPGQPVAQQVGDRMQQIAQIMPDLLKSEDDIKRSEEKVQGYENIETVESNPMGASTPP